MSDTNPLNYAKPRSQPIRTFPSDSLAIGVGLCGTVAAVAATFVSLWWIPAGSPIRPMGLASLLLLIAAATLLLALAAVLTGIGAGWRNLRFWLLSAMALGAALGPLPAAGLTLRCICALHSLQLEG